MKNHPVQVIYKPEEGEKTSEQMLVHFESEVLATQFTERQNKIPNVVIAKYLGKKAG